MTNSNKPLKTPLSKLGTTIAFILVALLGLCDASYLTIKHFRGEVPPCSILHGCGQVTTSVYSQILGIPVALLGTLYYLTILFGCILYLDTKNTKILKYLSYFTITGLLFSIYFTALQAFVIHSWCQYCLFSAFTSTILFINGMFYLKKTLPNIQA